MTLLFARFAVAVLLLTAYCLLPSYHLITLSAVATKLGTIVKPICLAVFRLITNSNL